MTELRDSLMRQITVRRLRTKRSKHSCALATALVATSALVSGCSGSLPSLPKISDLNPFAEAETRLPGKRVPVMPANASASIASNLAPADQPIALASAVSNSDWSQPGGTASNAPGHLVFNGQGRRAWSVSAGTGSTSRSRLSASPIVYGGRIFVLDAASTVRSFSISTGGRGWQTPLVPEGEAAGESFGGGLAVDDGRLIVATGFGQVVALDPGTGRKLWETSVKVPVRASPTAIGGQIYVIGADGRVFSLSSTDGAELWSFRGLPQTTRIISDPSPAVSDGRVIVPYPSGDLVALNVSDGLPAWSDSLASTRQSSLGSMSDVSRPVIAGGIVYAVGHSGRLVAIEAKTGERLWTQDIPGTQMPAVSGSMVFAVDTQSRVLAIDGRSGQTIWTVKLPAGANWSGPALGSGKLWLTSSKGALASIDAATGRLLTNKKVASRFYIAPIIASGRLFVLSDDARLMAFN